MWWGLASFKQPPACWHLPLSHPHSPLCCQMFLLNCSHMHTPCANSAADSYLLLPVWPEGLLSQILLRVLYGLCAVHSAKGDMQNLPTRDSRRWLLYWFPMLPVLFTLCLSSWNFSVCLGSDVALLKLDFSVLPEPWLYLVRTSPPPPLMQSATTYWAVTSLSGATRITKENNEVIL